MGKARRRGGRSAGREGSMSRGQVVDGDHSEPAWNEGRAKGELGVRQEERWEKAWPGHKACGGNLVLSQRPHA